MVCVYIGLILATKAYGDKTIIKLGYITGSEKLFEASSYSPPGKLISGAITMALDEINNDTDILPDHRIEFEIAETYGEEEESIKKTCLLSERIDAFIGPQETCIHEARLAAAFNKPMVSYVSMPFYVLFSVIYSFIKSCLLVLKDIPQGYHA